VALAIQKVLNDIKAGNWKPFYLIIGEEPFQADLIQSALRSQVSAARTELLSPFFE